MKARILGVGAATAALVTGSMMGATSASAQENDRGSITFPADTAIVECDEGVGIGLALDVRYSFHWTYEESELVRERLILNYTGYFENLTTGERSAPVHGTGNALTDFAEGTRTVSGTGRSMTMPGIGKVLHEAGHYVLDAESGEVLIEHGPSLNESTLEGAQLVCQAMGLSGGVPLEPPNVHD